MCFMGMCVKVDELLQQANDHIGQVVELEGYLLVIMEDDNYTPYLSPSDSINDNANIYIEHPLAELRKIIQPMHSLILSKRGNLTNPPYIYNFPLNLWARIGKTAEGVPVLTDIQSVSLYAEHPPNLAKWVEQKQYLYSAEVEYGASRDPLRDQTTKAKITAHRVLRFVDSDDKSHRLDPDENIYARRIVQKTITFPGWLKYLSGIGDEPHQFILRTFAVRASMMGIGPLRGMTSIWWRPNPQYKVVRAHMPLADNTPDINCRVDISGRIDYLRDAVVPIDSDSLPSLVFSQVDEIIVHQEDYLLVDDEDTSPE